MLNARGGSLYESEDYRQMLAATVDPEIEVRVHDSAFYRGAYVGFEGMLKVLREWADAWAEITYEIEDVGERGDLAAAILRYRGRGGGSGVTVSDRVGWLFEFRDDLVVRYEMFPDAEGTLTIEGLLEK